MEGDWNMVPDEWEDRWPSKFDNHHFNPLMEEFIRDNSLVDIWRNQNPGKNDTPGTSLMVTLNLELTTDLQQIRLEDISQKLSFPKLL